MDLKEKSEIFCVIFVTLNSKKSGPCPALCTVYLSHMY